MPIPIHFCVIVSASMRRSNEMLHCNNPPQCFGSVFIARRLGGDGGAFPYFE
ncbi:hypothetical protein [Pseudolabrys taiwanensis]|uniref:hypothetical protein n=1 Tax=Pseudolabrys taiwanensis TaxID=331696 RepID=UPI0013B3AD85|nr:hypothetical protein [Pseudolabrys taiwanensis]